MQTTLFTDGFQGLEVGARPLYDSVNPAIYFNADHGKIGSWSVATSLREEGFNKAWEIKSENGENFLAQTFTNLNQKNAPLSLIHHPLVVAGDSLWSDYTIEAEFTPQAKFDKCGIVFKYRHPADFYFFGIEGNTVTLKHIQQSVTPLRPIERILDIRPLVWTPGERIHATVTLRRNKVSTILNDTINMHAENLPMHSGRIGLISDLPAKFHKVEVRVLKGEERKLARKRRQLARKTDLLIKNHPKMVWWKKIDIQGLGSSHLLRMGDLNGDGNKELAFVQKGSSGSEVGAITVINLDGEVLWQHGEPRANSSVPGGRVPVQIHDLDGDGSREILFISEGWIYRLEGRTGKIESRSKLASGFEVKSLQFADLLGIGRPNCLLLSNPSGELLVLNEQLEVMWSKQTRPSSYPLAHDLDGDGKDEVVMGYAVFDPDGTLRYDVGEFIGDRCNGVLVYPMIQDDKEIPCLVYAAGDWGLLYFDYSGHLIRQNNLGHVGYMSVADFNMELPGLEVATSNQWGSDGLVHIMDASGEGVNNFLPVSGPMRCLPVNWKGDGEEFLFTSADSIMGGLVDYSGQLAVKFPADGHPVSYHSVLDLTGDARDELVVWNQEQLWIYTQDDNPRMGNTYSPSRNPLFNASVYHMTYSFSGW